MTKTINTYRVTYVETDPVTHQEYLEQSVVHTDDVAVDVWLNRDRFPKVVQVKLLSKGA